MTPSETPSVTILVPTYRLGGIECLAQSVRRQVYPHDRLRVILVDALAARRETAVREFWNGHAGDVALWHLEVPGFDWAQSYARAFNEGLGASPDDVIVVWPDYAVAPAYCVADHVQLLQRGGMRCASLGIVQYAWTPLEAMAFGFARLETLDAYRSFVEARPADSPLWTSLFLDDPAELHRANLLLIGPPAGADPRRGRINGPTSFIDVLLKNEAYPRAALVAAGGADEAFDARPDYVDSDLGLRVEKQGYVLVLDKGNEIVVPTPHALLPTLRWSGTAEDAHARFHRRWEAACRSEPIATERGLGSRSAAAP